ncbi:hypothetical protein T492DRAFT_402906 [Pavlovales sp. CCMP2436]|nr:hypothetical protein T492DRAFT_402906 [Pavlovales sp. CCMP2436]
MATSPDDALNKTLAAMRHRTVGQAHNRHVAAINCVVRLHAAAGFSLAQAGRVAMVMNLAAEALEQGALDYAQVLPDLIILCSVPLTRNSCTADRKYLHDVSELLSAVGSLLGCAVDEVCDAAGEALLYFALARSPPVAGRLPPTHAPPRGAPTAASTLPIGHRAAVNHAALEHSTAMRSAAEGLQLSGGCGGGDGSSVRRSLGPRAEARNRLLLRCLCEFTRAAGSARQLCEAEALGDRVLPLLRELPLDSAQLPILVEVLLNILQAEPSLLGVQCLFEAGAVSSLATLLSELLAHGHSARDVALCNDALVVCVALARAGHAPARAEMVEGGGLLATLTEFSLGLSSRSVAAFGPLRSSHLTALLALASTVRAELAALPTDAPLLSHLAAALVGLTRPSPSPAGALGGEGNEQRVGALRVISQSMDAISEGFVAAGGPAALLANLSADGGPALSAALGAALGATLRHATVAREVDLDALLTLLAAALDATAAAAPRAAGALSLARLSGPAAASFSLTKRPPSASLSRPLSASHLSLRSPSASHAVPGGFVVGEEAGSGAAVEAEEALVLEVLALACTHCAQAPAKLAALGGTHLLGGCLRHAARGQGAPSAEWTCALVDAVAAAVAPLPLEAAALVGAGGMHALLVLVGRSQRSLCAQQLACATALIEATHAPSSTIAEPATAHDGSVEAPALLARNEAAHALLHWRAPPAVAAPRRGEAAHLHPLHSARRLTMGDGGAEAALAMVLRLWRAEEGALGLVRLHLGVVEPADPLASAAASTAANSADEAAAHSLGQQTAAAGTLQADERHTSEGAAGAEGTPAPARSRSPWRESSAEGSGEGSSDEDEDALGWAAEVAPPSVACSANSSRPSALSPASEYADSELGLDGAPAAEGELSAMDVHVALGSSHQGGSSHAGPGGFGPPPGESARAPLAQAAGALDLRLQLAALVAATRAATPAAFAEAAGTLAPQVRREPLRGRPRAQIYRLGRPCSAATLLRPEEPFGLPPPARRRRAVRLTAAPPAAGARHAGGRVELPRLRGGARASQRRIRAARRGRRARGGGPAAAAGARGRLARCGRGGARAADGAPVGRARRGLRRRRAPAEAAARRARGAVRLAAQAARAAHAAQGGGGQGAARGTARLLPRRVLRSLCGAVQGQLAARARRRVWRQEGHQGGAGHWVRRGRGGDARRLTQLRRT